MRLMCGLLRSDKGNRSRLPNVVAVFDTATHRKNANSSTGRGYGPRSRLLTRLREKQGTRITHAYYWAYNINNNLNNRAHLKIECALALKPQRDKQALELPDRKDADAGAD
jgi:hypothetical protein